MAIVILVVLSLSLTSTDVSSIMQHFRLHPNGKKYLIKEGEKN